MLTTAKVKKSICFHFRWPSILTRANRVRCQSRFPMFIMAQCQYIRMSAMQYRCRDNCTNVKTFVTSAWYHWWHAGRILACIWLVNLLTDGELYWVYLAWFNLACSSVCQFSLSQISIWIPWSLQISWSFFFLVFWFCNFVENAKIAKINHMQKTPNYSM